MSLNPQTFRIWLEPGKNIVWGFTVVAKNAIATVVLEILGSKTPLAVVRCLLTTMILAFMLASSAECWAEPQTDNGDQIDIKQSQSDKCQDEKLARRAAVVVH
jgi:hypothetical protein